MNTIPISQLADLFSYDCESGLLRHKLTWGHIKAGDVAGTEHHTGYIDVKIKGKSFKAHRIAWALVTGSWPIYEIDHIDGKRSNNKWDNLRKSNPLHNGSNNTRTRAGGYPGVTWMKTSWDVRYKGKYIGRAYDFLSAVALRKQMEREDG
jgi:hypothetical protein